MNREQVLRIHEYLQLPTQIADKSA